MRIKIKEVKNRGILSEGRNSGMGFAFLKQIKENYFETIQPISPCKDYLNEVVFTENTGIGTRGCGLQYPEKLNIFKEDKAYLTIEIQNSKVDGYHTYSTFNKDTKQLENNYKNMEIFMSYFDICIDTKIITEIKEADNNRYLIIVPIEWTQSGYSISMYTLLLRISLNYDSSIDVFEYIDKLISDKNNIDVYLMNTALKIIKEVCNNPELLKLPQSYIDNANKLIDSSTNISIWSPHNYGICNLILPKKEII